MTFRALGSVSTAALALHMSDAFLYIESIAAAIASSIAIIFKVLVLRYEFCIRYLNLGKRGAVCCI